MHSHRPLLTPPPRISFDSRDQTCRHRRRSSASGPNPIARDVSVIGAGKIEGFADPSHIGLPDLRSGDTSAVGEQDYSRSHASSATVLDQGWGRALDAN